jgi:stage V sporulation protein B
LAARSTGLGSPLPRAARRPEGVPSGRAYITTLLPIAGTQLCVNLLLQMDIALLGHFLSSKSEAERETVKAWVATYKECQTFAFLPYQLLFSVTLILFPMLVRARAEGDHAAVRAYVARGSRLAAIFAGLLVCVIVAMPQSMLSFAYGKADAARGADVLRIMVLAQGAFTMLGIATTVLTSLDAERVAANVTLGAVVAVGIACGVLVPGAAFGHAQLLRSAQATGLAMAASLAVAGLIVYRRSGAFVPAKTAIRVAAAIGLFTCAGTVMPCFGRLLTPVVAAVMAGLYLVFLALTGEVGRADLAMIRSLKK